MEEKEKVVVLNSGGFDSVVLMHHVVKEFNQDIISVFFDYGQRNRKYEMEKAEQVAKKLGAEHIVISLPPFHWVVSGLYEGVEITIENEYIPMRNLVFLAYALSIAETYGASRVYAAFIGNLVPYADTSLSFVKNLRKVFKDSCGIRFEAPFRRYSKYTVGMLAFKYGIKPGDYFSCNYPDSEGVPCGKCGDCTELADIEKSLKMQEHPMYKWIRAGYQYNEEFAEAFRNYKVTKMQIYNNTSFNCKLTTEQWKSVFDQAIALGIKTFRFDDTKFNTRLWELVKYLKRNGAKCELFTEVDVFMKYIENVKRAKFYRVYVSVESMEQMADYNFVHRLKENNVPVTLYIFVTEGNYKDVVDMVKFAANELRVKNAFVESGPVEPEKWAKLLAEIKVESRKFPNEFSMVLSQPFYMLEQAKDHRVVQEVIENVCDYGWRYLTENVHMFVEFFYRGYMDHFSVFSDGFLGVNAGNIMDKPLDVVIEHGKELVLGYIKSLTPVQE